VSVFSRFNYILCLGHKLRDGVIWVGVRTCLGVDSNPVPKVSPNFCSKHTCRLTIIGGFSVYEKFTRMYVVFPVTGKTANGYFAKQDAKHTEWLAA